MKKTLATQLALFNTDAYETPPKSFLETHPDSVDLEGDDTESSVPSDWEQLMRSQQRCTEIRDRIQAIYADARAEGFTRRLPIEYEKAIRELNCQIIAELEASKSLRTTRHNYRGWMGEIHIAESVTRIRIVDSTGWLDYDDIVDRTSKAVAMLRMTQFIDAAIEKEERSPHVSSPADDSVTASMPPVTESSPADDSVTASMPPVTESSPADDSVTASMPPVTESSAERKYAPKGTARTTNSYFRYSYKEWGKTKHVHIPGGNTSSAVARRNWELVLASKQNGMTHSEIVEMIKTM